DAAGFVGQAEQVDNVPTDRGWDGSVLGLLQFPDVLRWLGTNPAWTDQMGEAVTYQQGDVLDAIQDYRRAVASVGNLKSNPYQKVRVVPDKDILIEPARPDTVYVPSYDPVLATQPQPAQVVQESPGINPWLAFGGGAVVGALGAWALYSIFDGGGHQGGGYYNGQRRIRAYNNYYYARGRRPPAAAWTPLPRAHRAPPQGPAPPPAPPPPPPRAKGGGRAGGPAPADDGCHGTGAAAGQGAAGAAAGEAASPAAAATGEAAGPAAAAAGEAAGPAAAAAGEARSTA